MGSGIISDRVENLNYCVGTVEVPKPPFAKFKNWRVAIDIIKKHMLNKNSLIMLHADVDWDGLGAAYVTKRFIDYALRQDRVYTIINKVKEHGMNMNVVNHVNKLNVGLFIIVDSSSNDIDYIKQMNCDVVVMDHHFVNHNEIVGNTVGGHYVIINNMIDNTEEGYVATSDMSGAEVVYETFRLFEEVIGIKPSILEGAMLYQWVGTTLISDLIKTGSNRNQWYMHNTLLNYNMEYNLKVLLKNVNKYNYYITKTFVGFSLVPLFNKAIRAGNSKMALAIALHCPEEVGQLNQFIAIQNEISDRALNNVECGSGVNLRCLDIDEIPASYSGIVATKILNETDKTAIAYQDKGSYIKGSFRGRLEGLDYRELLAKHGIKAQGHESAFGVEIDKKDLGLLQNIIAEAEKDYVYRPYLSVGNVPVNLIGIHHISNFDEFRSSGKLMDLSMANTYLSTREQMQILANTSDVNVINKYEKYSEVNVLGVTGKTFDTLGHKYVNIYPEYTNTMDIFVRDIKQLG